MKSHWTVFTCIATLCALCLSTVMVYLFLTSQEVIDNKELMAQEDPDSGAVTELRVRLFEMKQQLKEAHSERRELQLKLNEALVAVKAHELKFAELISGEEDGAKVNESLLKEIVALREGSGLTSRQFEEMCAYVRSTYKLLQADKTVKEKFKAKAALIRAKIASLLTAGKLQNSENGMVIKVNEKLDVVAISLGYSDGVTQGSEWQVKEVDRNIASLKIVEVRKSISLGVLTKGKLQDVLQGATVERIVKSK
jgi:hypothetical protein